MKLLTKVVAFGVYVLAVGGASTGATAAAVHLAARSPLASVTAVPSDFLAGTPSGREAPGHGEATGTGSDGPGGHADPAGDVQHEFSGVE